MPLRPGGHGSNGRGNTDLTPPAHSPGSGSGPGTACHVGELANWPVKSLADTGLDVRQGGAPAWRTRQDRGGFPPQSAPTGPVLNRCDPFRASPSLILVSFPAASQYDGLVDGTASQPWQRCLIRRSPEDCTVSQRTPAPVRRWSGLSCLLLAVTAVALPWGTESDA